jgi:hypothetical protein
VICAVDVIMFNRKTYLPENMKSNSAAGAMKNPMKLLIYVRSVITGYTTSSIRKMKQDFISLFAMRLKGELARHPDRD